jgi:hypothetical protein
MQKLRELSRKVFGAGGLEGLLQDLMDAAIAMLKADMGTMRLIAADRSS